MRISSSGNLGIGTTNPNALLEINKYNTVDPTNHVTGNRLVSEYSSDWATAAHEGGVGIKFSI